MRSSILNFFNIKLDAFVAFVFFVFVFMIISLFFLLLDYIKMRKRYMEFMKGASGKQLEYTIYKRFRDIDLLMDSQKDNDDQIQIMFDKVKHSYCKLGMYKYDAFTEAGTGASGGKMSFALCLLNSMNDGFIINAIHSRSGGHIYMKEIKQGACEAVLAEEEKEALKRAVIYKQGNTANDMK